MTDDKIDRLFKWIDLIKIALYCLVAGAVALTAWAVKIQMQTSENKADIELSQANVQMHRDKNNEKEIAEEHRLTKLETDDEWTKNALSKMR
jgi:hypothetical protein